MSRKLFCAVCKKNGRPESEYTSHNAREGNDETSRPLCPILLDMTCNRCGNVGHIAARCPDKSCVFCNSPGHTVFYCNNAPRDQIDAFLKYRNQEYEDRKMRNRNGFDNRRPYYNDNNSRPMFNDNNSRPMFNDNNSRPMFNDNNRLPAFNNLPPATVPKQDEFPSLGSGFPVLGKKEEFPSLGKPKTTEVPKMNFAGITSIMVEQKPKIDTKKIIHKKEVVEEESESDEELTADEYRSRLYDKLMNEFNEKQSGETWDLAYKRIMRTVDRNTVKYEEYLESKNQPQDNYCDDW